VIARVGVRSWASLALLLQVAVLGPGTASAGGSSASPDQIIAEAKGKLVAVYSSPRATKPSRWLSNPNPDGAQLVFLVKYRLPGWEQVYLPMRPNGSTGWIRDQSVTLTLDPYRVQVFLGRHRVVLWRGDRMIDELAAGVGRTVLPTPRGTYYIVELLKQPDPYGLYGPYAFGLSAYSDVLSDFSGGPGQIGLHGTNDPAALGTDVSHGCIRISNAAISRFAKLLPLGTPVEITD